MENASKALFISGGMLIAILLLTFFSYMFSRVGEQTASIYDQMEEADIREFNQKFLQYDTGDYDKENRYITIQDVVTIVNLAIQSNKEQKYTDEIVVRVEKCACKSQPSDKKWTNAYKKDINKIMENHITDVKENAKFTCDVGLKNQYGISVVSEIEINLIKE